MAVYGVKEAEAIRLRYRHSVAFFASCWDY